MGFRLEIEKKNQFRPKIIPYGHEIHWAYAQRLGAFSPGAYAPIDWAYAHEELRHPPISLGVSAMPRPGRTPRARPETAF